MPWSEHGQYIPSGSMPLETQKDELVDGADPELAAGAAIDLRSLPSPVNLLRANAALRRLAPGEQVAFLTLGSPQNLVEFKALADRTGHSLLSEKPDQQGYWFLFQRR